MKREVSVSSENEDVQYEDVMRSSNSPKPSNTVSCCIILDLHHVFPHSCGTLVLAKGNYQLSILLRDSRVKITAFMVFIYLFFLWL